MIYIIEMNMNTLYYVPTIMDINYTIHHPFEFWFIKMLEMFFYMKYKFNYIQFCVLFVAGHLSRSIPNVTVTTER